MTAFPLYPGAIPHKPAKRRSHKRLPQSALHANGCEVLDLSESGLRIISRKALAGEINLCLTAPGIEQTVVARVIWCRKHAKNVHEIGLLFANCVQTRQVLRWIAHWNARPLSA